jgi:hypothetical protein
MADSRIDPIDSAVYTQTSQIRTEFAAARQRLGLRPENLTPVTLGMRSVSE